MVIHLNKLKSRIFFLLILIQTFVQNVTGKLKDGKKKERKESTPPTHPTTTTTHKHTSRKL